MIHPKADVNIKVVSEIKKQIQLDEVMSGSCFILLNSHEGK